VYSTSLFVGCDEYDQLDIDSGILYFHWVFSCAANCHLVEWQLCLAEGGGMWRSIPRGLQWWEAFTALVTDSNNLYILKEDIDSEKKKELSGT